jgi:integrase
MELQRDHLPWIEAPVLREIVAHLPALPSVIRYRDDFDGSLHSIRNPSDATSFAIHVAGRVVSIRFDQSSEHLAALMKQVFLYLLGEDLTPSTAVNYVSAGRNIDVHAAVRLLEAGPTGIASVWANLLARDLPRNTYACAKAILKLLSKYRLRGWSESYRDVISALPLPFYDKYAVVRSGDAFLSAVDEATVVRFFDETAANCATPHLDDEALQDAAMLLCAYQFGMRPVQIAMVTLRDMRIRHEPADPLPTVHLTFRMVKQRSASATKPLLRRVKREWAPLFVAVDRLARMQGQDLGDRAFSVQSASEAGRRIASLLRNLIGDNGATAFNLRHTAAQRLVDAGASQEELAEFLSHSDITTGLVYYETSANQAERVNKALGISEIYQRVARIAHARSISPEELAQLKESQQLGGVPHGLSIAGIGGCTSGQPACPYNPIMSCYGCRKFMPVHDLLMHEKILSDFRGVARFFHDASRGDSVSPAYPQLERTISEVQAVVHELESTTS